ncbi:MAG: helix-turn-helix transcriptional regulator [Firmicutes bacterium]|uniref:Tetratricopeptide repeat-containing protein n=1 Tax=Melghirimyces thermohalophilus TaxID=1236220 RepID=A0A1G6RJI8_9BACL|nr:tetratricopeptide repeat protein [Melghirimyces thermohalophilus]MDA8352560.1 helix-turn-helix transcriptional regulator [Bacillota bacterium]SDD04155.1 Tetratricopeptide repeat-containing protein [Melghirimyces thermohalophilus]
MLQTVDIYDLGRVIRKVRKERGLRLEDLADGNISPATISNIERGVPHVRSDRAFYVLEKLGISSDQVPELLSGEQHWYQSLERQLKLAEVQCEIGNSEAVLKELRDLSIGDDSPLAPQLFYIRGKCWVSQKKWKRAEQSLHKAIHLADQTSPETNIEAAAYLELGVARYQQNDLVRALQWTDSGISAFQAEGDRPYLWYILQKNRGLFLERLGRVGECLKLVQDIWPKLKYIDNTADVLAFYWLRAEMCYRMKMATDAIHYASEGLDIARRSLHYRSIVTLCTVLGNIYMKEKEFHIAERYYQTALNCPQVGVSKSLTKTLIGLGVLYSRQGDHGQALDTFDQAIQNAREHNDAPRLVNALLLKGDLYGKVNKDQEAIRVYEEALHLARDYGYKKPEHRALYCLAEMWKNKDEEEFFRYIRNMYEIQKDIQDKEDFLDEVE